METIKVNFAEAQAYEIAHNYFIKTSGLTGKKKKHARMMQVATAVREQGAAGINIRAEVSFAGAECYCGHKIIISGSELNCTAFQQIDDDKVKGIYFYVITCGECSVAAEENIMELLYADIWGTAYVDAGRDLLKDHLTNDMLKRIGSEGGLMLSGSFGPGFYGMEMAAAKDIYAVFENNAAGIDLRETGIMVPLKSCIGLHLVVEKDAWLPGIECRDCLGNVQGCSYCRIRSRRK